MVLQSTSKLRSMFTAGAPNMTIYIDGPIGCSDHRILPDLYDAHGELRPAQTFVCSSPCGGSIDVVNVHAPSGSQTLKDPQRKALLTNLLQSSSKATPGASIGNAHFLIGGDMNTSPFLMSQLLQTCRDNCSLLKQEQIHRRVFAKHGDLCIVAGVQAETLTATARHYDPQHEPYGICWSMPQRSATEQPSSIRQGEEHFAASSSGYATEQSLPALSAQTASSSPWVWDRPPAAPRLAKQAEVVAGVQGSTSKTTAPHYDPQHQHWSMP